MNAKGEDKFSVVDGQVIFKGQSIPLPTAYVQAHLMPSGIQDIGDSSAAQNPKTLDTDVTIILPEPVMYDGYLVSCKANLKNMNRTGNPVKFQLQVWRNTGNEFTKVLGMDLMTYIQGLNQFTNFSYEVKSGDLIAFYITKKTEIQGIDNGLSYLFDGYHNKINKAQNYWPCMIWTPALEARITFALPGSP